MGLPINNLICASNEVRKSKFKKLESRILFNLILMLSLFIYKFTYV